MIILETNMLSGVRNYSSAIMEPIEPLTLIKAELSDAMRPDIVSGTDTDYQSIPFILPDCQDQYGRKRSFLLMDSNENLSVSTPEIFIKKLQCQDTNKIKVVSIFGNTGDGKSHTMNYTFFNGDEVFRTSNEHNSCTIGVWAAIQKDLGILCLDTEGLLGTTINSNRHMRMLLKILAISDIVIFRTRSERLHSDMFQFLGTASKAFCLHFASSLQSLELSTSAKALGPAVIIFHETKHTKPLISTVEESSEDILRNKFTKLNLNIDAFSSLRYIGIQTNGGAITDYQKLFQVVNLEIDNTNVRSSRQPSVVFKIMQLLNTKFSNEISEKPFNPFPEQYFTCTITCESCGCRCQKSMGHLVDGENHSNSNLCLYQQKYDNRIHLCRNCHRNGKELQVIIRNQTDNDNSWYGLAKYAWTGSVIECPNCGEIYKSRQYWYGNKSPEDIAIRSEIVHIWKDENIIIKSPIHSAQMIVDGVSYLTEALSSLGSQPSKILKNLVADKVAPSYWKSNSEIIYCHGCRKNFEKTGLPKHHCRGCGEGFCHNCSKNKMAVPSRGWNSPVRVCYSCEQQLRVKSDAILVKTDHKIANFSTITGARNSDDTSVLARKYSEVVYNTLSSVATVLDFPKDIIKDNARPSYWVPDSESPNCYICKIPFGTAEFVDKSLSKNNSNSLKGDCWRHHCRACGKAVCESCSLNRRPVPERGWTNDVRVCNLCYDKSNV